jgi:hypothetical protein
VALQSEHTFYGVISLAVLQVGKTLREWLRDSRRHAELMAEVKEAKEHAASSNRKHHRLRMALESKGLVTPTPFSYADTENPVTDHGLLPGLRRKP